MTRWGAFYFFGLAVALTLLMQLRPRGERRPEPPPYGVLSAYPPPGTNAGFPAVKTVYATRMGDLILEVDPRQKQLQAFQITLRVAYAGNPAIASGLNPSITTKEPIRISGQVEASVTHDGSFDVAPLLTAAQIIDDRPYLEWRWKITPRVTGPHEIHLLVRSPEKHPEVGIYYRDAFQRSIGIEVQADYLAAALDAVLTGWKGWLWSAVQPLVPLLVFVYGGRYLRRYPLAVRILAEQGWKLEEPEPRRVLLPSEIDHRKPPQ